MPWLTKGSGIPVTGSTPTHMPIFSMKWNANIAVMHITINEPYASLALIATYTHLNKNKKTINMKATDPMNPISSPITVNIKSVSCSGT